MKNIFLADCSKYYVCNNGEIIAESQCADGLLFDPITRQCRPEEEVDCGYPTTAAPTSTLPPKPECPAEGFDQIPHECKNYKSKMIIALNLFCD